jgi:hypothetical protein
MIPVDDATATALAATVQRNAQFAEAACSLDQIALRRIAASISTIAVRSSSFMIFEAFEMKAWVSRTV